MEFCKYLECTKCITCVCVFVQYVYVAFYSKSPVLTYSVNQPNKGTSLF